MMYCYESDPADRCCCRERDVLPPEKRNDRKKVKRCTPQCAADWPTFRKKAEVLAEPVVKKKKNFFQKALGGKDKAKEQEVLPQFNDLFHDQELRQAYKGKEKWDDTDRS